MNEDAFAIEPELGLYIVADGMGGHVGGEVAARTAISTIVGHLRQHSQTVTDVGRGDADASALLDVAREAVQAACRRVYLEASTRPGLAGMGCTATLLLLAGRHAAMAHVGDCRLYLLRRGGAHQLSADHTMAAELARSGAIDPSDVAGHPRAHVLTRAVGSQELVEVDLLLLDVVPGDRFVIASDGLTNYLATNDELSDQAGQLDPDELCDQLVAFANSEGGEDNVTVVCVGVDGDDRRDSASPVGQLEVLASTPLFSGLTLVQLSRVLASGTVCEWRKGDVVALAGEHSSEALVVLTGSLSTEPQIGTIFAGQHVGATHLLDPRQWAVTLTAADATTTWTLADDAFAQLTLTQPRLGRALLTRLARFLATEIPATTSW